MLVERLSTQSGVLHYAMVSCMDILFGEALLVMIQYDWYARVSDKLRVLTEWWNINSYTLH